MSHLQFWHISIETCSRFGQRFLIHQEFMFSEWKCQPWLQHTWAVLWLCPRRRTRCVKCLLKSPEKVKCDGRTLIHTSRVFFFFLLCVTSSYWRKRAHLERHASPSPAPTSSLSILVALCWFNCLIFNLQLQCSLHSAVTSGHGSISDMVQIL